MKQRTYIYVDGFNLYYGCPRKSPYKWLDLKNLFLKLLNDYHEIIKIKLVETPGLPPFARAYKTEEKGSDVNLAVHLLHDSWHNRYDSAVLVSNDSDLAEPLRLVKAEHQRNIGIIFPNIDPERKPSRKLCQFADFVKHIRSNILASTQLPDRIPNSQIFKPAEW